jgi:hypothetical protein
MLSGIVLIALIIQLYFLRPDPREKDDDDLVKKNEKRKIETGTLH